VSDLFGIEGRRWLEALELPAAERETVDSVRQVDFLEGEIAGADRVIATEALRSPEVRRLMTVPGVNVITAATFRRRSAKSPASDRRGG
jgi:transposase